MEFVYPPPSCSDVNARPIQSNFGYVVIQRRAVYFFATQCTGYLGPPVAENFVRSLPNYGMRERERVDFAFNYLVTCSHPSPPFPYIYREENLPLTFVRPAGAMTGN